MRLGQTTAGRYLQVIDVLDETADSVFVITAHEPRGKARIELSTAVNRPDDVEKWRAERAKYPAANPESVK